MEEIKRRETTSTYEYDGRTFEINSYDPMVGNYILMQIITLVLPLGITAKLSEKFGTGSDLGNTGRMMSKAEFVQFQIDILSTISEIKQSGHRAPVVRQDGTYGIDEVTSIMCIKLIIASLAFNYKDFFKELPSLEEFMLH